MLTEVVPKWLSKNLSQAAAIVNDATPVKVAGDLRLGVDLGTSDVVSIVIDKDNHPVGVCLEWADVVRDGVVLNYHGAIQIVRRQIETLKAKLGTSFSFVNTSYPPGTDPRISVNVIEGAGLEVASVVDEPSAVASLLALDHAAVVDIGGGTTGIAILDKGKVAYSGDEPTGGRHVTLTIAGSFSEELEKAEKRKLADGRVVWPVVKPVFEKMADIVREHIKGHNIKFIYLSGGSCALPGVGELFQREFPEMKVILPNDPIFLTPYAIAAYSQG